MELTRLKRILALGGALVLVAGTLALLVGASLLVVRTGSGANPADAFNETEIIPSSLAGRVAWGDDAHDLDRPMEASTRTALEAAWIQAAASRELAAAHAITAESHDLQVDFYSLDGQIARLTGTSRVRVTTGDQPSWLSESYEAILVLTDGRWSIDQVVRTNAILIEA